MSRTMLRHTRDRKPETNLTKALGSALITTVGDIHTNDLNGHAVALQDRTQLLHELERYRMALDGFQFSKEKVKKLADLVVAIHKTRQEFLSNTADIASFERAALTRINDEFGLDARKILVYLALNQPHGKLKTFNVIVELAQKAGMAGPLAVKEALGIRHIINQLDKLPEEPAIQRPLVDSRAD
ncbi:MAG: hypothetical protein KGH63_03215 [Candidatus Micrarchaeota archaeon]|nr:hypothetical protein [Candidatus Micrarchaeota archaeon]